MERRAISGGEDQRIVVGSYPSHQVLTETDPFHEDVLLRMAAAWCAVKVRLYDIPIVRLTEEEWKDGTRGFLAHEDVDWRRKDPGDDFPWDRFLDFVAAMSGHPVVESVEGGETG